MTEMASDFIQAKDETEQAFILTFAEKRCLHISTEHD